MSAYCTDEVVLAQGVRYDIVMILNEDRNNAHYQIQSFSPGKLIVNNELYTTSVIITPSQLIQNWSPRNIDHITDDDFKPFLSLQPKIILLGTGDRSKILPAQKLALLLEKQFHVECMNTAAACRTYMALSAEGRNL